MTTWDVLIEKALREENIFPPSVLNCHYGDKPEMTKAEIILRSLEETGLLSLSGQGAQFGAKWGPDGDSRKHELR